jgi:phosphoglycerate dehydrogenase-like enzyme
VLVGEQLSDLAVAEVVQKKLLVELEQAAEVRRLAAALAARQTPDFEAWELFAPACADSMARAGSQSQFAQAAGILGTNTPEVVTNATTDITILLLLGASRRTSEGEALVRTGKWHDASPTELLGWQLTGKNLVWASVERWRRERVHLE